MISNNWWLSNRVLTLNPLPIHYWFTGNECHLLFSFLLSPLIASSSPLPPIHYRFTGNEYHLLLVFLICYSATTFSEALGSFASPHIDRLDAGGALTAMTLILSTPSDYSPGIFALHDLMLFIKPTETSIVYFTGLHRHGGIAPSPPPGQNPDPTAYRLTIICYPNGQIMAGRSRNALAPWRVADRETRLKDVHEVLKIPPEVRYREE